MLQWRVDTNSNVYVCLMLPVMRDAFKDGPFVNKNTHVTISYKLRFHGDMWRGFWAMKSGMQCKLCRREISMIFDRCGRGHTFALRGDCELVYVLDSLREVIYTTPEIEELAAPPMPYHVSWLDL